MCWPRECVRERERVNGFPDGDHTKPTHNDGVNYFETQLCISSRTEKVVCLYTGRSNAAASSSSLINGFQRDNSLRCAGTRVGLQGPLQLSSKTSFLSV